MRAIPSPVLATLFCWTAGAALATWIEARQVPAVLTAERGAATSEGGVVQVLLGESRKLLASQFFTEADVYFHGGYYPSIFDARPAAEGANHLAAQTHGGDAAHADAVAAPNHAQELEEAHEHGHEHGAEHERSAGPSQDPLEYGFLGPPRDPFDAFGRHFFPSRHAHLEEGVEERELLPWLRLATALDPSRVEAFSTAAFWLRARLQRVDAAEALLLEGWRANPHSPEILFELGRLLSENRGDVNRARNLWEAALAYWHAAHDGKPDQDTFVCQELLANLAYLEDRAGNKAAARHWLEALLPITPHPETIRKRLRDLDAEPARLRP